MLMLSTRGSHRITDTQDLLRDFENVSFMFHLTDYIKKCI